MSPFAGPAFPPPDRSHSDSLPRGPGAAVPDPSAPHRKPRSSPEFSEPKKRREHFLGFGGPWWKKGGKSPCLWLLGLYSQEGKGTQKKKGRSPNFGWVHREPCLGLTMFRASTDGLNLGYSENMSFRSGFMLCQETQPPHCWGCFDHGHERRRTAPLDNIWVYLFKGPNTNAGFPQEKRKKKHQLQKKTHPFQKSRGLDVQRKIETSHRKVSFPGYGYVANSLYNSQLISPHFRSSGLAKQSPTFLWTTKMVFHVFPKRFINLLCTTKMVFHQTCLSKTWPKSIHLLMYH